MSPKMIQLCLCAAVLSLVFAGPSMAASVDVAGDCYYFANGDLTVVSLTSGLEIAAFGADDGVSNATEVVVKHGKAVVTTDDGIAKAAVALDISGLTGCYDSVGDSPGDGECNEERYLARYKHGLGISYLEIPGVEVNEKIYNVTMQQRGNSSNWQVSFVEEVVPEPLPAE